MINANEFEFIYLGIVYVFLIIGLIYLYEGTFPRVYISLVLFFLFKMITKYEKCTISYIECKLRNVKKEDGYLYDFLHSIISLRETKHANFIYGTMIIFIIKGINFKLLVP